MRTNKSIIYGITLEELSDYWSYMPRYMSEELYTRRLIPEDLMLAESVVMSTVLRELFR